MTCACEKCNQKRVIDCLFVKVDVNLHIARETQLFLKINSLHSGTMAESCWESSSEEELFLTQLTFTVKSDEYDVREIVIDMANIVQYSSSILTATTATRPRLLIA
ncbi:hypothetical protein P5673_019828 [Acropora cervicornis]|uniref:Uncharacterized protein n=1 Tax=Acropora cervicornis TaxID=6130 RepID=A0AAD9V1K2_ACRCE|nr:hypothetical protein P5673_019828 [Acropora cervicornis]